MTLPPDIEFHEDIRLLIYKPRGLLSEASVNKIVNVIENLEAKLQQPFNRFQRNHQSGDAQNNGAGEGSRWR